jgi:replicative DNA helicase
MGECLEKISEGEIVFYDLRHQTVYSVCVEMYDAREPIDIITLQERLKQKEYLEEVGGIGYLMSLPDAAPSVANLAYYIDIIREKYVLRRMLQACAQIAGRIFDYQGGVEELMDEFESSVLSIRQRSSAATIVGASVLVKRAMQVIEDTCSRAGAISGLETGFVDLDKMTDGMHPGEMIVFAARPSVGKTSLAMNIAENVALDQGLPVAVFSLEMTSDALMTRMLCSRARVNLRSVRDGFLSERDLPRLTRAAANFAVAKLYIDDSGGLSIMQLRAKARRVFQQFGVKLIIVDYLQLLHSTSERARENRTQEIGDISGGLKALAKELNVPVLVLSQLNRDVERRGGGKPKLSELREGGAIEQDADLVGLLYKPAVKEDEEPDEYQEAEPVNLYVAKQRNGPIGEINFTFLKSYTRFESASKLSGDDIPAATQERMEV